MASIGSVSFDYPLYWATKWKGQSSGNDKRSLDGSIISIRLASQPDEFTGEHTFEFTWEPQDVIDGLQALARSNQVVTINPENSGSYSCYFPKGENSISFDTVVSRGKNISWSHAAVNGYSIDLYSGSFTVILV